MEQPAISSYFGKTPGKAIRVDIGVMRIWFSYRTPIAFRIGYGPITVRENEWGPTTGKHLNAIDGGEKAGRVNKEQFQEQFSQALRSPTLTDFTMESI